MTANGTAESRPTAAKGGGGRRLFALALLVLVALIAAGYAKARTYVLHDARFCGTSCHAPKDGSGLWHTRGHDNVECQSCHTTPPGKGLSMLWSKTLGHTKDVPKHSKPNVRQCSACHETKPAEWRLVAATEGHRTHRALKDVDCLSCHAKSSHDVEAPSEKLCLDCHKMQRLHKSASDAETCLSCHSFAVSAKLVQRPTTMACEGCHADSGKVAAAGKGAAKLPTKEVNDQVLHGGLDCKLCHDPHGRKPPVPEGQPVCARCHQFEIFQAGTETKTGPEGHRNCEGCHQPHALRKHALQSCVKCHEKKAKGITPMGQGTSTALKHESCASCHLPHSWRAERSGCMTCHEEKAASILNRSPAGHSQCTNCHDVHGPTPTGAVCLKCHANTKKNHVALAPQRHKDCTACHDPHAASKEVARGACAGCHTVQLAQVMRDGPDGHAKETCFGCHKPHENPLPQANICAKCHADKGKLVATAGPPKHRVCTSCHQPHKFAITDPATACSKCHGPVIQAEGPHKGDCKKCHTLHGSPGVPKTACFQCHETIQAGFKPPNPTHDKCRSCHQPHRPAALAPTACPTCHERQATAAKAWPPQSAHAQKCNGCHTPHDVKTKKPCAGCHEKEFASATGSKHQCQQCHAPHRAPPGTGPAWWTRCAECHTAQAEGVKTRGPKHGECKNCHEPHRFGIPACTSCHSGMQEKGAHAVKEHAAKCNACHNPHTTASPNRAQCLACHTKQRDHQPDAQRCQACHPFQ